MPGYKWHRLPLIFIRTSLCLQGADLGAKLKLLGVDVGVPVMPAWNQAGCRSYIYLDEGKEIYKRLIVSEDNKYLLGAVLVVIPKITGNL